MSNQLEHGVAFYEHLKGEAMSEREREHHEVLIDLGQVVEGENTFTCTICHADIVLVWDGQFFTLREEDANNPNFGTVGIEYT